MAEHSPIGWTDATWPLVGGCEYVSPGCSNCWAVRDSWRMSHNPNPKVRDAYAGTVEKTDKGALVWSGVVRPLWNRLAWPLKWRGSKRVFVCSQSDLFNRHVPFEFIAAAFGVMAIAQEHTFQVLTKHPARALEFFEWLDEQQGGALETCLWHLRKAIGPELASRHEPLPEDLPEWPLPNVHFGVTVEDQARADERIPVLMTIPAAVRWISAEPLLEAIDLRALNTEPLKVYERHNALCGLLGLPRVDWVVCGGESAQTRSNTRPFDIDWARALLKQCRAAGVPFFMKQLGTVPIWHGHAGPGEHWPTGTTKNDTGHGYFTIMPPVGKTSRYKFHEPEHWPEDIRVQEFPA